MERPLGVAAWPRRSTRAPPLPAVAVAASCTVLPLLLTLHCCSVAGRVSASSTANLTSTTSSPGGSHGEANASLANNHGAFVSVLAGGGAKTSDLQGGGRTSASPVLADRHAIRRSIRSVPSPDPHRKGHPSNLYINTGRNSKQETGAHPNHSGDLRMTRPHPDAWAAFRPDKPSFWLHIPKTGTSFIVPLLAYATGGQEVVHLTEKGLRYPALAALRALDLSKYPSSTKLLHRVCKHNVYVQAYSVRKPSKVRKCYEGLGNHDVVPDWFSGNVLAFFRKPSSHLPSFLSHFKKTDAKQFSACQTMKVLGIQFGAGRDNYLCETPPTVLTPAMMREAARRVDNMAFVGLTEFSGLSNCLFHAVVGLPMREGETVHGRHKKLRRGMTALTSKFTDSFDCKLYEVAVHRFRRDVRTHLDQIRHLCPESYYAEALEFLNDGHNL